MGSVDSPHVVHFALTGSGDSPRVGIFRRHPERIFQWAENRSVPAENNMSERGVRPTHKAELSRRRAGSGRPYLGRTRRVATAVNGSSGQ